MLFLLTSSIVNNITNSLPIQNKQPLTLQVPIRGFRAINKPNMWENVSKINQPTRESIVYSRNIQIKSEKTSLNYDQKKLEESKYDDAWFLVLKWDSKTDTFVIEGHLDLDLLNEKYDVTNLNSSFNDNSSFIRINNENNFNIKLTKKAKNEFSFKIISKELSNKINFSNIKSLSIHLNIRSNAHYSWGRYKGKENNIWEKKFNLHLAFLPNLNYEKKDIQIQNINEKKDIFIQNGIKCSSLYSEEIKMLYKKISIHPSELLIGTHNKKMLQIKNNGTSPFNRVFIKPKSIENIPTSKNTLHKITNLNMNLNGDIIYEKNTFYDLNRKETITGFGPNSHPGYVIPYDYSGTFFPVFTFDANEYKDIKISWPHKIPKPFFDKKDSIVSLNLKNTNDNIDHLVDELKWLNIKHNFFDLIENKDLTYDKLIKSLKKDKLER